MNATATTHSRDSSRRRHLLAVPASTTVQGEATASTTVQSGATAQTTPRRGLHWSPLVIRLALAADNPQLRRLAHLDSARPLSGQALLAEQGGAVIAALSLDDGAAIADPFVASADAVAMLRVRAAQLGSAAAAA